MSELSELLSKKTLEQAVADLSLEDEHLINGGSQMSKRLGCSGSLEMEFRYPKDSAGYDAQLGTKVHERIEEYIPIMMDQYVESQYIDIFNFKSGNDPEIDAAAELACKDVAERIINPLENHEDIPKWWVEKRYIANAEAFRGGKADFSCWIEFNGALKGVIWDYKNGRNPVDAATTPQLIEYAVGMYNSLKTDAERDQVVGFDLYIFQPNSSSTYRTHRYVNICELKELTAKHQDAALTALGKKGERRLNAGKHCMFCSGKVGCPAFSQMMQEEASLDFEEDPEGLEIKGLSEEKILAAFKFLPLLSSYKKDLEAYIIARGMAGQPVPGTETIYKRNNRTWIKDIEIIKNNLLNHIHSNNLSQVFTEKPVSQAKVSAFLKSKGASKEEIQKCIEMSTTKPGKRPVAVLEEEVRDRQIARAIVDEFDEIEEE